MENRPYLGFFCPHDSCLCHESPGVSFEVERKTGPGLESLGQLKAGALFTQVPCPSDLKSMAQAIRDLVHDRELNRIAGELLICRRADHQVAFHTPESSS